MQLRLGISGYQQLNHQRPPPLTANLILAIPEPADPPFFERSAMCLHSPFRSRGKKLEELFRLM